MSKVYAVSSGSYSDYSVRAIFSTREKAQAMIDWIKSGPPGRITDLNDVEEYELDEAEPPANYREHWFIKMDLASGAIETVRQEARTEWSWPPSEEPARANYWPKYGLEVHCHADNEAHAIKIATEKRQEWLAKLAMEGT